MFLCKNLKTQIIYSLRSKEGMILKLGQSVRRAPETSPRPLYNFCK